MPVATESVEHTDYPRYQAYLLRLWQEQPGAPWRVMVQKVEGNRQWKFSDSAQCFDFIRQHLQTDQYQVEVGYGKQKSI